MKSAVKAVVLFTLLFTLFGATLAHAQPQAQFQHVILVIQENRTPDNLFGAAEEPNTGGFCPPSVSKICRNTIWHSCNQRAASPGAIPWCLGACFDPNHGNSAWQAIQRGDYNRQRHTVNVLVCRAVGGP